MGTLLTRDDQVRLAGLILTSFSLSAGRAEFCQFVQPVVDLAYPPGQRPPGVDAVFQLGEPLQEVADRLVEWCEQRGVIRQLVVALAAARPRRGDWQQFRVDLGLDDTGTNGGDTVEAERQRDAVEDELKAEKEARGKVERERDALRESLLQEKGGRINAERERDALTEEVKKEKGLKDDAERELRDSTAELDEQKKTIEELSRKARGRKRLAVVLLIAVVLVTAAGLFVSYSQSVEVRRLRYVGLFKFEDEKLPNTDRPIAQMWESAPVPPEGPYKYRCLADADMPECRMSIVTSKDSTWRAVALVLRKGAEEYAVRDRFPPPGPFWTEGRSGEAFTLPACRAGESVLVVIVALTERRATVKPDDDPDPALTPLWIKTASEK